MPRAPDRWRRPSHVSKGLGPLAVRSACDGETPDSMAQNSSRKMLLRTADKGSHWPKLHQDKGGNLQTSDKALRQLMGGGCGRNVNASTTVIKHGIMYYLPPFILENDWFGSS